MPKGSFSLKGAVCSHSAFCLKSVGIFFNYKNTKSDIAGISIINCRDHTELLFFVNCFETQVPHDFNMQIGTEYEEVDHRIIELFWLEETFTIIKSDH